MSRRSSVLAAVERLEQRILLAADFGDAPDLGAGTGTGDYETTNANGGPSHTIDSTLTTLFLGASVDGDAGTLQNGRANADDVDGALPDDEDGVFDPADLVLTAGTTPTIRLRATNNTGSSATLSGWIDYDGNGVFDNATERAQVAIPDGTTNGIVTLTFPTVPFGFTGTTYARFRLSTDAAAANPTGAASDGEVEDYVVSITVPGDGRPGQTTEINFSTANGPNLQGYDRFGSAVTSLGDLDGDGVTDIAVGAFGDDEGGNYRGAVHVLLLNADGSVKQTTEINSSTTNGPDLADGDNFGRSVTSLGDLDGDGVADIAVGAIGDDEGGSNRGTVHVLLLNADGSVKQTTEINSSTTNGPDLTNLDYFGTSVTSLGDLDGDGVTDIAVGARGDDEGGGTRGAVHVLLLNADGSVKQTTEINSSTANGPDLADGDRFGSAVASLGDLDGDGITDIAVGAERADDGGSSRGAVHVLLLNANGSVKQATEINTSTTNGPVLTNFDFFGRSVTSLGDLDGDGVTDIAVGAYGDNEGGGYLGAVHVLLLNADGSVKRTKEINASATNGPVLDNFDYFGSSVTSLGDLDGDGVTDIAVGAERDDDASSRRGAVHIVSLSSAIDYGDAPDLGAGTGTGDYETLATSGGPSHRIDSTRDTLFLGASVDGDSGTLQNARANADDVDGALPDDEDGVFDPADLVLTAGTTPTIRLRATNTTGSSATLSGWIDYDGNGVFDNATERAQVTVPDGTNNGIVTLVFPTIPTGFTGTTYARFRLSTDAAAANPTGAAGDGEVEDVVVSITKPSNGRPAQTTEINSSTTNGPELTNFDNFGRSVASLGDLDGDGVTDVAVGADGDDEGGSFRGAVHVLLLNADGSVKQTTEINSSTVGGPNLTNDDQFGKSVASLGDLDGDGVTDIAVGAIGDDEGGDERGAVHVLFLNADGSVKQTTEINSSTANGPNLTNDDFFGSAVTSLGDLDGDGVTDIAVGAYGDDEGGLNRGAVHVLLLNADGSVKQTTEINSSTAGGPALGNLDYFGYSVTSLGDLDGDGVTDIAVGANGDDEGGSARGAVHVLLLNADGSVKLATAIDSSTAGGPDLANIDRFGSSVTSLGDLDGDGVVDIAVGAYGDDEGGSGRGAVHVLLLNADGSVKLATEINSGTAGGPNLADSDSFGISVTALGDLDGDGVADIAVGARGDDEGGTNRGAVHVISLEPRRLDYGDAPDSGSGTGSGDYETVAANNGPSHVIVGGLKLGAHVDEDDGTLQSVRANADDVDGALPDDEDGVFDPTDLRIVVGTNPTVRLRVTNTTGTAATLHGWIDYDANGVFDNATERAQVTVPDGSDNAIVTLVFPTVPTGFTGTTYARFRLSTDAAAADPTGAASDGEVEDYLASTTTPGDGRLLRTTEINSSTAGGPDLADLDSFGRSVASLGDLDGDGVTDIAVGANGDDEGGNDRGSVHVLLLNADGSVKQATEINSSTANGPNLANYDRFGTSVTSLGDLDGDGVTDIAVGAYDDGQLNGPGQGAVYVLLLNTDGSVKQTTVINTSTANGPTLAFDDRFGRSVTSLGDLDGDGVTDIAVGASGDDEGGSNRGAVHVLLLNADGSVKQTTEINSSTAGGPVLSNSDFFGESVASLGDLDGDGVTDIAVGAYGDDEGGDARGAVHILLLNADGSVKQSTEINSSTANGPVLAAIDLFGSSVTSLGDFDGDGVTDIAVGAFGDVYSGARGGTVHVLLLNADGSVKQTTRINSNTTNGPNLTRGDSFGISVTSLGDLDGDGVIDLAVGADDDDGEGNSRGAVHLISLARSLVVDNDDPGYAETGTWADSGLPGFEASGTRFSTASNAVATWSLPRLAAGWYTVQLFNVQHPSNTTNAHVTITHGNATETRGLSQRDAPNGFTTIGTFYFDGSANESIALRNLGGGVLRADAIRVFATPQPPTVVIDNFQTGYFEFGSGWADSGLTGSNGSSTRFTAKAGSGVTYRPANLVPGWYTLEFFNVQHPSNTTNARVTVVHAGATETRTLDQRNSPNGFVTLGRFYFDGSATQAITLQNLGGDFLRADAIRLTAAPPPGPGKIDNGQTGYSEFGVWGDSGLTGSDGSSTRFTSQVGAGATWRPPANLAAGWYTLDLYNVQHPTNTTSARITIKHAGNTITRTINPQTTPNGYLALGTFYLDGSGAEAVTIQNLAAGALRADALRIRATPPPAPITIDNGQSGHSEFGVWADSGLTGVNGSSTRFTSQTGAGATYRPANLVAGFYVVEVYNVKHPSNTTNARVTIKHAGVTETRTLDQRNSPNGYVSFGTFFFDGLGSEAITLQNLGGLLRADAVRLRSTQPPQAQTQQAAPGLIANSDAPSLTTGDLDSLIDDALAAWAAVGVDPSAFDDVRFAIGDLAGNTLGTYSSGLVTIDTNAAGHGWFVDTTPEDDTEFTGPGFNGGDSPAGFDLFTVLKHELGHHLGLPDETDGDASLLEIELDPGERRHITETEIDLLADRDLVETLLYG